MGIAAENVAEKYRVTREQQDLFALSSHKKAVEAMYSGHFRDEIVPLSLVNSGKDNTTIDMDECPRPHTSLEKLSALRPAFKDDGTVTAGNACPINDGAAVTLVMSMNWARKLGLKPLLVFVDAAVAGVDPKYLGIGPVPAVQKLLKRTMLSIHHIDVVEFNEAFAAQVIASLQELRIPWNKVNRGGGAIALGHPYGASGAVLVTRLCTNMQHGNFSRGLATLGIGGGIGLATLFKKAW